MRFASLPFVTVPVGVVDGLPPVGCSVTASVGVGLPVGCTVLVLLVVLVPVKVCKIRTYCTYSTVWGGHFAKVLTVSPTVDIVP